MENWNEFLEGLYEQQNRKDLTPDGIEIIDCVKRINIPFNLKIEKCFENFDIIDNYSLLDYRRPNFGTKSITRILTEKKLGVLSENFSKWFLASLPDVYIWATPSSESKFETLDLLENLIKNHDRYLINHKTFNTNAYLLLSTAYKKENKIFETE